VLRHRIASDRRLNADRFYATPCSRHAVCGWGLVYCLPLDIIRRLNGSNSGTVRYRRSVWLLSPAAMSIVSQHTDSLTGNDLLLVYKILFGLLRVNSDIFFTPRNKSQLRGHAYMLHKQRCFTFNRRNFPALELLACGTVCPPKPRTFLDYTN